MAITTEGSIKGQRHIPMASRRKKKCKKTEIKQKNQNLIQKEKVK